MKVSGFIKLVLLVSNLIMLIRPTDLLVQPCHFWQLLTLTHPNHRLYLVNPSDPTCIRSSRTSLRVRAFFHKTVRGCHVNCNFKIGFTCRINVNFGTLKDGSLLINTLASNICFSYRNMFQNGVDALSKIVDAFLSKSSKFHLVRIIR